jgi:AraC-like DNA-binding protein
MAGLRLVASIREFMRAPVGAAVIVETNLVWCASPSLGGSTGWGSPSGTQVERVMGVVAAIFHPSIGPQLDIVLDGHRLEHVSPAAVMAIFDWTRRHLDALKRRIRRQVGVPPPGIGGMLLSGMLPMLGNPYRFQIVSTPEAAYRAVLGSDGDALRQRIAGYVDAVHRTPPVVAELRMLLRARQGSLTLDAAARELGRSPRSLQRELDAGDTSFREEQMRARTSAVAEILATSDDKIAAVAAHVGLSVTALNRLVRERIGSSVDAWRRRLRNR